MADKKYLGLGFAFNATDKGLKSSLRETKEGVEGIGDGLDETEKKSESFFKGFGSGLEKVAAFGIGAKIHGGIEKLTSALDDADESARNVGSIDAVLSKFQALGQLKPGDETKNFLDKLGGYAANSAADIGELTDYVSTLQKQGFTFDEISKKVEGAADSIGRFGMTTDDILKWEQGGKALGFGGLQMEKLKEKLISIGKETGHLEILKDSSEMIGELAKTTAFQNATSEQREKQLISVAKTQALFNKGIADSGQAMTAFEKIMAVQKEFTDLETGISDGTDEFKKYFELIGGNANVFKALKAGDTTKFMQSMSGSMAKMGGDKRFLNLMTEALGPEAVLVIKQMSKGTLNLNDAFKKAAVSAGDIDKAQNRDELMSFNKKYREDMAKNIDFMKRQLEVTKEQSDIQAQSRALKFQKKFLEERIKRQVEYNKKLYGPEAKQGVLWDSLRAMKEMEGLSVGGKLFSLLDKLEEKGIDIKKLIPPGMEEYIESTIEFISDHFLELAFIAPTVYKGFGKVWKVFKSGFGMITKVGKGVKDFGSILGSVGKEGGKWMKTMGMLGKMGKFGKVLAFVGKVFGKFLLPLDIAISGFMALRENWDDLINAFKTGSFGDIFNAILETVSDFIDNFTFGLFSPITGAIEGVLKAVVGLISGESVSQVFDTLKESLREGIEEFPLVGKKVANWVFGEEGKKTETKGEAGSGVFAPKTVEQEKTALSLMEPVRDVSPLEPEQASSGDTIDSRIVNNTTNNVVDTDEMSSAISKGMDGSKLIGEFVININGKKTRQASALRLELSG